MRCWFGVPLLLQQISVACCCADCSPCFIRRFDLPPRALKFAQENRAITQFVRRHTNTMLALIGLVPILENHMRQFGFYKPVFKYLKRIIAFAAALWLIPLPLVVWLITGLVDVTRNRPISLQTLQRYFCGNGIVTWMLSPFNLFIDLCCFPNWNSGIYRKVDLPTVCQSEIDRIVTNALEGKLAERVCEQLKGEKRGMMMFKWYGQNLPTTVEMPFFHEQFQYIQTIGVSVFNRRQSTSLHFGPIRPTLRVLYNINEVVSEDAYIDVGNHRHFWSREKLFIFDDTLQHRSVNDSDALRVCLFVDILRPSYMQWLLRSIVTMVRLTSAPIRRVFYKNWTFLK